MHRSQERFKVDSSSPSPSKGQRRAMKMAIAQRNASGSVRYVMCIQFKEEGVLLTMNLTPSCKLRAIFKPCGHIFNKLMDGPNAKGATFPSVVFFQRSVCARVVIELP